MNKSVRKLSLTAMGIALFVVLTMCLQVPVFENYYLCLGYIVMAMFCCYFGPLSGTIVGTAGVVIYCLLTGGLNGMPGWAIGNIVIGILVGLSFKLTKNFKYKTFKYIFIVVSIVVSTAIGILVLKSLMEVILYAHPFWVRVIKNSYAFIADVIVLIISLPLCESLKPVITKYIKE